MEFNWKTTENKQLIAAMLSLENKSEAERFLRDLMTEGEIAEFGKRLEAARLLSRNIQYNTIIETTGLSSTTIARIAKWLKGSLGGYRLVINRMHHTHPNLKVGKGLSLRS